MKILYVVFLFSMPWFDLCAQTIGKVCGPVLGHHADTVKTGWYLYQHSKNAPFEVLPPEELHALRQTSESLQLDTLPLTPRYTALRYTARGKFEQPRRDSFSFVVGSCAMPYPILFWSGARREPIFERIKEQNADFMLWMGDNVYYLFGQWNKAETMAKVHIRYRSKRRIAALLENQPNYAVWDDHDYGPNNSGRVFAGKESALEIHKKFWMNPSYGEPDNPGVYTRFSYQNADFFLLDSRYHSDKKDRLLGERQMAWLQEGLRQSKADFKFVISPVQVLSQNAPTTGEDWMDYKPEHQAFLDFLKNENIPGVVLVSGDVHYGQWAVLRREGTYPLHEITASPLTSFVNGKPTRNNPNLDKATLKTELNFGRIVVAGDRCRIELRGKDGNVLWARELKAEELR